MPNSVRSYPNKLPSVIVASLNPELLPFLETVPLLRVSTNVALPACHPSLLTKGGYLCQSRQPPRGLSPGITPHDLPHSGRPDLSKAMGDPSLRPGQLDKLGCHQRVQGGHLALQAGFEHAGKRPWQLHNQTAGSSG